MQELKPILSYPKLIRLDGISMLQILGCNVRGVAGKRWGGTFGNLWPLDGCVVVVILYVYQKESHQNRFLTSLPERRLHPFERLSAAPRGERTANTDLASCLVT